MSLAMPTAEAKRRLAPLEGEARATAPGGRWSERGDVQQFIDEVSQRHGLSAPWMLAAIARADYSPTVARLMMPAPRGTAKNWAAYRSRFIEPVRVNAGLAFWRDNETWLALAQARYGVPPEIVVGIIGVESIYGRHMGNFRIIDALATLAFDFPVGRKDRSALFREELENYFVLCQRQNINPMEWRGSYAGAIGMPQFLPSSFNKYAVDLDGDGHINLHDSAADVIGSVANYLKQFGWQAGLPARFEVTPPADPAQRARLLEPDIVPSFTAAEMRLAGATLPEPALAQQGLFALVALENADQPPSHVAGTANFYAITRYNWSSYYALAVIELGEAIARERSPAAQ
jgi:membrane-bound lytic murein transglycosylase B